MYADRGLTPIHIHRQKRTPPPKGAHPLRKEDNSTTATASYIPTTFVIDILRFMQGLHCFNPLAVNFTRQELFMRIVSCQWGRYSPPTLFIKTIYSYHTPTKRTFLSPPVEVGDSCLIVLKRINPKTILYSSPAQSRTFLLSATP